MVRTTALVLALAFAAISFADGDDPPKGKPAVPADKDADKPKDKDAKDAPAPAAEADEPQPIRGTRYQIALKTGRAVAGVVTCEKVFERRDGVNWATCDKDAPGAGVRLFFVKDADGFVFVPTKDMKSAEKLDDLTEREGRELAKRRIAAQRRADEDRDRLHREEIRREADAKAKASESAERPKDKDAGGKAKSDEPSPAEQIAKYTALLTKYPPGKWTLDTPKDIERRRIVMDLFPTDEEKAFLAVFDDWSRAYASWKAGQEAAKAAEDAASKK